MSKEKQIEEMAKEIEEASCGYGVDGCHRCEFDGTEDFSCAEMRIAKALYNAGYRKQSEGEWITDEEGYVTCSVCGEEHTWDEFRPPYCDMCGAKMKGGE